MFSSPSPQHKSAHHDPAALRGSQAFTSSTVTPLGVERLEAVEVRQRLHRLATAHRALGLVGDQLHRDLRKGDSLLFDYVLIKTLLNDQGRRDPRVALKVAEACSCRIHSKMDEGEASVFCEVMELLGSIGQAAAARGLVTRLKDALGGERAEQHGLDSTLDLLNAFITHGPDNNGVSADRLSLRSPHDSSPEVLPHLVRLVQGSETVKLTNLIEDLASRDGIPKTSRALAQVAAGVENVESGKILLGSVYAVRCSLDEKVSYRTCMAKGYACAGMRELAFEVYRGALTLAKTLPSREAFGAACKLAESAALVGYPGVGRWVLDELAEAVGPYKEFYEDPHAPLIAVARSYGRLGDTKAGRELMLRYINSDRAQPAFSERELAQAFAKAELFEDAFGAMNRSAGDRREIALAGDASIAILDAATCAASVLAEYGNGESATSDVLALGYQGIIDTDEMIDLLSTLGDATCADFYRGILASVNSAEKIKAYQKLTRWKPPVFDQIGYQIFTESLVSISEYLRHGVGERAGAVDAIALLFGSSKELPIRRLLALFTEMLESSEGAQRERAYDLLSPIWTSPVVRDSLLGRWAVMCLAEKSLRLSALNDHAEAIRRCLNELGEFPLKGVGRIATEFCAHALLSHPLDQIPLKVGRTMVAKLEGRRQRVDGSAYDPINLSDHSSATLDPLAAVTQRLLMGGNPVLNPALLSCVVEADLRGGGDASHKLLRTVARDFFTAGDYSNPRVGQLFARALYQVGKKSDHDLLLQRLRERLMHAGPNDPLLTLLLLSLPERGGRRQFGALVPGGGEEGQESHRSFIREYELVLEVAAHARVEGRFTRALLRKLAAAGFLDREVVEWLEDGSHVDELPHKGACIRALSALGVVPSRVVLEYFTREGSSPETVEGKLESITARRDELSHLENIEALVGALSADLDTRIAYYVPRAGQTRFQLINNYPFERFQEIIELASNFDRHRGPLDEFGAGLQRAGLPTARVEQILSNLLAGRHPFFTADHPALEERVRIDVSDTRKIQMADREASRVCGGEELGTIVRSIAYRGKLRGLGSDDSSRMLAAQALECLEGATTLQSRGTALTRIEQQFPELRAEVLAELSGAWEHLAARVHTDLKLSDLLCGTPRIRAHDLLGGIELLRRSKRASKTTVIQALKGDNPQIAARQRELQRKERALRSVLNGLRENPEERALQTQERSIQEDISRITGEVAALRVSPVVDRYRHLSSAERKEMLANEEKYLRAVIEKSPARVLVSSIVEMLDEALITEGDSELLKEVASHLEAPFEAVQELVDRRERVVGEKVVRLRHLDKVRDLVTFARFADSRLCCYSSSNYSMTVNRRPNREWLAARLMDPLSFVWVIEEDVTARGDSQATNNLGFVMGDYGISEQGLPTVNLNGIYSTLGNDERSSGNLLSALERLLAEPMKADTIIVGSFHGGAQMGNPPGYVMGSAFVTRLRALRGPKGTPLAENYDDLGTIMNRPVELKGFVKRRSPEGSPDHEGS